ncbi:MAG: 2-succinyl-5-enolpyruvyl-6-hydroxy-3-cyclohexene-1-carboxylate synthase, partial [Candidatus Sericytochromatia bacterium]|nr:2-succinyl-5-enolpyruvyl-6-hydroxy-3-cyclohexene-1-carboxylate synthase [Candidatus Sericytochromatia bacterium]
GNSMPIRYANYISADILKNNIQVNANRGTSGIDGTVSTSLGACLVSNKLTTIIVGDLAFFYDHNALWNNYIPANLRIIVMNNHGGGIFRILEGSGSLSELDKYFETENKLNAENTARDFNLDYIICNNYQDLDQSLKAFFSHSDKAKILEIETNSTFNTEVFNNFKLLISKLEIQ